MPMLRLRIVWSGHRGKPLSLTLESVWQAEECMSPRSLASSTGSAFIDRAIARQVAQGTMSCTIVTSCHARQVVVIWMTLPTTERRVWHGGDHSTKGPDNLEHRNNHTII